ncbi:MAG: UDP-N-acetylmuramoyl-L-alanyl-D-glutamate--2,6-diaminopimelate ligase [Clostridia bacterium]|nr:UDP-N-acetylmuramoyl-L-alanyl-D-glutamate--2,6-diaminopimelate ligase [Clostridia bacterium]
MRLDKLIKNVKILDKINYKNVIVTCLTHNSKECVLGSMFFAISGYSNDGKNYVMDAVKNGAKVVVTDSVIVGVNITQIVVENVRQTMSIISKQFYNNAVDGLKIIGVIGTAGKTTTTHIISHILSLTDKKCGVIGTNGIYVNNIKHNTTFTTPDPIELHKIFLDMKNESVEYVIMEVSAQSIYLEKMYGVHIDIGVFTNVSNEHLDFFKTMDNYIKTKCSIFNKKCMSKCVINIDDTVGHKLYKEVEIDATSVGIDNDADYKVERVVSNNSLTEIKIKNGKKDYILHTTYIGKHNVYNIVQALVVATMLEISTPIIIDAILSMPDVSGRCNRFSVGGKDIVIDFAHTPSSIENILISLKDYYKKDMVTVFGAVGYSDKEKRKQMGEVVSKYSSKIIITSDNPGNTCFMDIASDILLGVRDMEVILIEDRAQAIKQAYNLVDDNMLLVILGKGHEDFQMINNERVPYSDVAVINSLRVE